MAERVGFEPTVGFPLHSLSRRALSTAQTPLRGICSFSSLTNGPSPHNIASTQQFRSVHFKRRVHQFAVALHLKNSGATGGDCVQRRSQAIQRIYFLAVEGVDDVSGL